MSLYLEGVGHFQSIEDLLDLLVQGGGINSGFTLSVLLFFFATSDGIIST